MSSNDSTITSAGELKLQKILTAYSTVSSGSINFQKWFLQQFTNTQQQQQQQQQQRAIGNDYDCSLERFAQYFLTEIRKQTFVHLHAIEAAAVLETPCLKKANDTDYDAGTAAGAVDDISTVEMQQQTLRKPLRTVVVATTTSTSKPAFLETSGVGGVNNFPVLGTPSGRCSNNHCDFTQMLSRNASTPTRKSLNQSQQKQKKQSTQNSICSRRSTDSANRSLTTTTTATTTPNTSSFERSRNSTGDGNSSIGSSSASNSFCLGDFLLIPTLTNRQSSNAQKKKIIQSSATSTPNSTNNNKPKKRVVPISVGKKTATSLSSLADLRDSGPFGANSSFSQANNILILSQNEVVKEFNKNSVAEARKALKHGLSEVSSVIKATATATVTPSTTIGTPSILTSTPTKKCTQDIEMQPECSPETIAMSFEKLPKDTSEKLKILASIYGILIDLNLTTNVLHEFSFLLNILNANTNQQTGAADSINPFSQTRKCCCLELLKEVINSIFFAVCVLEEQQHTLALIDIKSLGVVLQCERLVCLSSSLKALLNAAYAQKQQSLATVSAHHGYDIPFGGGLKSVCFQEDSDSRKFFRSNNEFGAFKSQRDLFYGAIKLWEKHHLYPSWNFTIEIAPKVREIFRQSENPVNMTHFAKLFVSQLLISGNEQTTPEDIGIGTDDVNLEKFNKLSQRLIAPSNFSVDYQFPREQAFFRDFIIESHSVPFIEHLKMVLYSELAMLNDSSLEQHINLLHAEDDDDGCGESNEEAMSQSERNGSEYIVRPNVLASMLILAKFLGFVTALPFQASSSSTTTTLSLPSPSSSTTLALGNEANSSIIQSHQLRLRRLFQPAVNICHLLETANTNGRHLITIPWIVQYLAMLDDVTLQLDSFVETIHKLYDLYISLGSGNCGQRQLTPTSSFIVRCCLGWLFEQKPVIGDDYFNYRAAKNNTSQYNKLLRLRSKSSSNANTNANVKVTAILDSILPVACPFLAEFRVSIMPAKHAIAKYVSRSGRFRHITPLNAEPLLPQSNRCLLNHIQMNKPIAIDHPDQIANKRQKMLMESFLHAQNSSMQRLINFLTERVYKCVIRDAQFKILLPSKATADRQVNELACADKAIMLEQVKSIYQSARNETHKRWDNEIPKIINERTENGLEALLPIETAAIIKKAYAGRIRSTAKIKIEQWRHTNLYKNDFYCNDVNELTAKLCNKANVNNRLKKSTSQTTELKLIKSQPSISELIEEMQHWLYTTGFQSKFEPEIWSAAGSHGKRDLALIEFLERLKSSFENTLPTIYYRLIGAGLVQLLQQLISRFPICMTEELIKAACKFFSNDRIRSADVPPSTNCSPQLRENTTADATNSIDATPIMATTIYHGLITAPFIANLGSCPIRYDKLKSLLCALIDCGCITIDFVNELFISVFKEDLAANIFNAISKMLYELAQKTTELSKSKKNASDNDDDDSANESDSEFGLQSQLFMEVLADLSRDVDDF